MTETVTIDRLGRGGDGLAEVLAVPYTLPGETVRIEKIGKVARPLAIESASPDRVTAPCRHFGLPGDGCGGCHLQHLGLDQSLGWKVDRVRTALDRTGLPVPEIETHQSSPKTRRRARLGLIRTGRGWHCGFRQWRSHHIVPMTECHVLDPDIFGAAMAFANAGDDLVPDGCRSVDLSLTKTVAGLDVELSGVDEAALPLPAREALAAFAAKHAIARLVVSGVPLIERASPDISFGGVDVRLPDGTFLQATPDGEAYLTRCVLEGVGPVTRVADLFCGLGTFTLPLAGNAAVTGIDADGPAIDALTAAVRRARLQVETARRDLFDRPLDGPELDGFDAVVLDPPRAGAGAQAEALARSDVETVVSVSCNPDTFARDAAILGATYDLISLSVVDQFIWSPHIELAGVFKRRG